MPPPYAFHATLMMLFATAAAVYYIIIDIHYATYDIDAFMPLCRFDARHAAFIYAIAPLRHATLLRRVISSLSPIAAMRAHIDATP